MIEHLPWRATAKWPRLTKTMHEDRKRVFIDALGWDLPHHKGQERDQYDNDRAEYLILRDSVTGQHKASVRLLPSTGPHILGDIFPFLCDGEVPRGPDVWEITRYLASPRYRAAERMIARNMMARALIEYGLLNGIRRYSAVCDISFLSQILAAGWRCDPLGLPQIVDGAMVGAFVIHVDTDSISRMTRAWRFESPALRLIDTRSPLAA